MKKETQVQLSENGDIRIPAAFRHAMGIGAGGEVVLRIENHELRISSLRQYRIARARRLVRE